MNDPRWVPGQKLDVYSVDGHLVGRVAEAWPAEYTSSRTLARLLGETGTGYFRMTGFKDADLYVPLDAVSDFSKERVRLNITRKQLAKQGWDKRPDELRTRSGG